MVESTVNVMRIVKTPELNIYVVSGEIHTAFLLKFNPLVKEWNANSYV